MCSKLCLVNSPSSTEANDERSEVAELLFGLGVNDALVAWHDEHDAAHVRTVLHEDQQSKNQRGERGERRTPDLEEPMTRF